MGLEGQLTWGPGGQTDSVLMSHSWALQVDELWTEIAEPFAQTYPKLGIPLGEKGRTLYR